MFFCMLYRKKYSFYKGMNIIVCFNMIFRLKDYVCMLFLIFVIIVVILIVIGVIYMFYVDLEK